MEFFSEYSAWFLPIGITAACFVMGLTVEHLLLGRLRRAARETAWEWDDFVVESLGHAPTLLLTAAGAYVGLLVADYALAETLNRTMLVLLILAGTAVAARLVGGLVRYATSRPGSALPASSLLTNLARVFVYLIGVVIILQSLDIPITPLVTTLGIGGLAVALALQPTLSNVFAGFQMLAAGQVSAGDYIRLDSGEEGYVLDIKWRNTTIQGLFDDHEIVVPNSKLADAIVTNYYLPRKVLWLRCDVGVGYESDLETVEAVSLKVAHDVVRQFSGNVRELKPALRFHTFGDSSVDFTMRIPVEEFSGQFRVRHEFVKRLHARYRDEGINIPFPIRTLQLPETLLFTQDGRADQHIPEDRSG
jgi:small-conductance mechanosensitive channel